MRYIVRICKQCGKKDVLQYKSNQTPSLFCRSCGRMGDKNGNWRNGRVDSYWRFKYNHPIQVKVCPECGIVFTTKKTYKKYCTIKCALKKSNRENHKKYKHIRRAREKGAKGSFTMKQFRNLIKTIGGICPCCKQTISIGKFTIDHIRPLVHGGNNDISNIQPLCLSCNIKKNTKTINYLNSV